MKENKLNGQVLEQLYDVIESRRGGDPKTSHTAKLLKKGRGKICKKFGEEAVEVIIAALHEKKSDVVSESADVLYHMCCIICIVSYVLYHMIGRPIRIGDKWD